MEFIESDPSCDYSDLYPDVVGYYINEGTEKYICISVGGGYMIMSIGHIYTGSQKMD